MTWFAHRNTSHGPIISLHRELQVEYAEEEVADDAPEVLAFFAAAFPPDGKASYEALIERRARALDETDPLAATQLRMTLLTGG